MVKESIINDVIREYPGTMFCIQAGELGHFSDQLIDRIREEFKRQQQIMANQKEEELLSPEKVMSIGHISRSTLYRLTKAGILVPVWIGGQRRYRQSDIQEFINEKPLQSKNNQ